MSLFKYCFVKYSFIKPFIFNTSKSVLPKGSPGPHGPEHGWVSPRERLCARGSWEGLVRATAGGCAWELKPQTSSC